MAERIKPKITQGIVMIFGLSELTALMVANLSTSYYAYFITNVLMVAPVVMGTILIFTRAFDIGTLLLSGVVEESMNPKWGKYRSWLAFMCPFAAIIGILQYSSIGGSQNTQLWISAICYIIFFGLFNFGRTAQLALLNALGATPADRAMLSARKAQFAAVAGIILNSTFMPLVLWFSGTTKDATSFGFLSAIVIFQVIYLVPQLGLFKASKAYDLPEEQAVAKKKKLSPKEMMEQIFKNPPLMLMLIAETCKTVCSTLVLSMAIYYFRVVVNNLEFQPIFSTAISIAGFVGSLVAGQFIVKRIGKKNTYLIGFAAPAIALVCARIFGGTNDMVFLIIMIVGWFFFTFIATPGPAMFADCVEYGKYKIGKEGRAFIMSLYTLPIKIGVLIAGGFSGYLLAAVGYSAGAEVTKTVQSGIFSALTLAPAAVFTIGFVCMLFYKLSEKRVVEIMEINRQNDEKSA